MPWTYSVPSISAQQNPVRFAGGTPVVDTSDQVVVAGSNEWPFSTARGHMRIGVRERQGQREGWKRERERESKRERDREREGARESEREGERESGRERKMTRKEE